jgi:hypothetical protein
MNEVWDQFIRNEEAFTRLLTLDELLSLNQKVNELIEGRLPRPKEPTPLLAPEAMKMILPLIYEQIRLRAYPELKKGRMQLQLSEQQMASFLKEVAQADEKLELVETRRQIILEQMAAIIGLTYAELGDGAPLTDDEALDMIRDLLLDYDDHIITRNYERGYGEVIMGKLRQRTSYARKSCDNGWNNTFRSSHITRQPYCHGTSS